MRLLGNLSLEPDWFERSVTSRLGKGSRCHPRRPHGSGTSSASLAPVCHFQPPGLHLTAAPIPGPAACPGAGLDGHRTASDIHWPSGTAAEPGQSPCPSSPRTPAPPLLGFLRAALALALSSPSTHTCCPRCHLGVPTPCVPAEHMVPPVLPMTVDTRTYPHTYQAQVFHLLDVGWPPPHLRTAPPPPAVSSHRPHRAAPSFCTTSPWPH